MSRTMFLDCLTIKSGAQHVVTFSFLKMGPMKMTLLICVEAVVLLMAIGYLAACAGAMRWLTLREWWG